VRVVKVVGRTSRLGVVRQVVGLSANGSAIAVVVEGYYSDFGMNSVDFGYACHLFGLTLLGLLFVLSM